VRSPDDLSRVGEARKRPIGNDAQGVRGKRRLNHLRSQGPVGACILAGAAAPAPKVAPVVRPAIASRRLALHGCPVFLDENAESARSQRPIERIVKRGLRHRYGIRPAALPMVAIVKGYAGKEALSAWASAPIKRGRVFRLAMSYHSHFFQGPQAIARESPCPDIPNQGSLPCRIRNWRNICVIIPDFEPEAVEAALAELRKRGHGISDDEINAIRTSMRERDTGE